MDVRDFFNREASAWADRYRSDPRFIRRFELIREFFSDVPLKDRAVADIGCGAGFISRYLCESGARVTGIDVSPAMIEAARQNCSAFPDAKFVLGPADKLAFPDRSLDAVTCISVLEYVPDEKAVLAEIARVLKLNGVALISVPNASSFFRKLEKLAFAIKLPLNRLMGRDPGYLVHQKRQMHPGTFESQLAGYGLRKRDGAFFAGPLAGWSPIKTLSRRPRFGMLYMIKLQRSE